MVEKKRVLVTGGLGNLGSWLTKYFCDLGWDVSVMTKNLRMLEFDADYELVVCDISDKRQVEKAFQKQYDVVIHAASMNDHFVDDYPAKALVVNALGTRHILEAIKDNPPEHFIYFSTFHVYGQYSGEITEQSELVPKNDYGATHLFAEYYVKQFHASHGIPYTIIRLSNSYGCPKDYDSSKWYLILNDLSRAAFEKSEIVLRGNGLATRDFIWMGDVCAVIGELALTPASNETYNLSGEKAISLLEVAKDVQAAYKAYFNKEIEVKVNEEDKSEAREGILINSQKLKCFIPYNTEKHFKEEALNIFKFLAKRKS